MAISPHILAQARETMAPLQAESAAAENNPPILSSEQIRQFDAKYNEIIAQGKIQDVFQTAVQNRNRPEAEYLLERGANVNGGDALNTRDIPDSQHYYVSADRLIKTPPIVTATENKDTAMIGLLLSHNADIEARNKFDGEPDPGAAFVLPKSGQTPLQIALDRKDDKTAEYLLDKHANVMATDQQGRNSVHYAATGSDKILDRTLLEGGSSPAALDKQDAHGSTPLAYVAHNRSYGDASSEAAMTANAKTLLYAGASVDPAHDNRILSNAARSGNETLVDLLLAYKADPSVGDKSLMFPSGLEVAGGNTPLMDIAGDGASDKLKSMRIADKLLAQTGTDINAGNDNGKTALMNAVQTGDLPMTSYLLSKGADINKQDMDGKTAMDYASPDKKSPDTPTQMQQFLKDVKDGNRNPHNPLIEPDVDLMPKVLLDSNKNGSLTSADRSGAADAFSGMSAEDKAMIARMTAVTGNGSPSGNKNVAMLPTPAQALPNRSGTLSV